MTYSYIIQYVSVYLNQMPTFANLGLGNVEAVIRYLNNLAPIEGYVFQNYAPSGVCGRQYFSDINAKKIDAVREQIQIWYNDNLISKDEFFVLLSSLIDAADFIANISGTYGAYLKIWRSMALKPLTLKVPEINDNNKDNEIYQQDANILIRQIECDVLYIDPPYNERQYAPNLISNAKARYIVVSYNNEGIIPREEIIRILQNKGEVTEYTTDYRRFRTERDNDHRQYKQCDDKVVEHLYIVNVRNY